MDKPIVIVADDYELDREFIQEVFKRNHPDYQLEIYNNGIDVEERFLKGGFYGVKLVILDHVMDPGKRGLDLIRDYSEQARACGCNLYLHTGEGLEKEAIVAGAAGYISKPIALPILEKIISDALAA